MRRLVVVALAIVSTSLLASLSKVTAQQGPQEIPFDSVPNFFRLPEGLYFGEAAGVALNKAGHIFVYTRKGSSSGHIIAPQAASVYEFNPDGTFVREIKDLFSMAWAHAVRFDNEDNMWLVDNGSDMVVKLDPQRRVQLVLGRRRESVLGTEVRPPVPADTPTPAAVDTVFNEPTDVTWDPQGNIFVSDGYKNQEVAKFDKYGKWIGRVGKGNGAQVGDGPGEFNNPHGIASDVRGNIYVADRANARVEVLDSNLKFLRDIRINVPAPPGATRTNVGASLYSANVFKPGAPWAVCITPGPNQVLFVADAYPGRVYKLTLDGQVLGYFGTDGKQLKQFNWIHAIACPSENDLYVAELLTWRVQKLTLHPRTTTALH
jgi:sugar lactone lactonase YvrE